MVFCEPQALLLTVFIYKTGFRNLITTQISDSFAASDVRDQIWELKLFNQYSCTLERIFSKFPTAGIVNSTHLTAMVLFSRCILQKSLFEIMYCISRRHSNSIHVANVLCDTVHIRCIYVCLATNSCPPHSSRYELLLCFSTPNNFVCFFA